MPTAGSTTSDIQAIIQAAVDEAKQRGDRLLGTEHLFLALLHSPDSVATRALGVDISAARAALDALDRTALAAIGLDLAAFPFAGLAPLPAGSRKGPRMSTAARAVIARAGKEAIQRKARHIESTDMALALLAAAPPDPVAALLAELRVDRAAVRERLNRAES